MIKNISVSRLTNYNLNYNIENIGNLLILTSMIDYGREDLVRMLEFAINDNTFRNIEHSLSDKLMMFNFKDFNIELDSGTISYHKYIDDVTRKESGHVSEKVLFLSRNDYPKYDFTTDNYLNYLKEQFWCGRRDKMDEEYFGKQNFGESMEFYYLKRIYQFIYDYPYDILILHNIENDIPLPNLMKLAEHLSKLSKEKQIIISTNSPTLIIDNRWDCVFDFYKNKFCK